MEGKIITTKERAPRLEFLNKLKTLSATITSLVALFAMSDEVIAQSKTIPDTLSTKVITITDSARIATDTTYAVSDTLESELEILMMEELKSMIENLENAWNAHYSMHIGGAYTREELKTRILRFEEILVMAQEDLQKLPSSSTKTELLERLLKISGKVRELREVEKF